MADEAVTDDRGPLRIGGRFELPTGETIAWSIAEGARGRRWREAATRAGCLVRTVLLETDPGGNASRLELQSATGLLTLHPESDRSAIHGNVVTADGIRHLAFAWSAEHTLLVDGSPAAMAIALGRLAGWIAIGGSTEAPVVIVDERLAPDAATWTVTRVGDGAWRLDLPGRSAGVLARLDRRGLPLLPGRRIWPLEP